MRLPALGKGREFGNELRAQTGYPAEPVHDIVPPVKTVAAYSKNKWQSSLNQWKESSTRLDDIDRYQKAAAHAAQFPPNFPEQPIFPDVGPPQQQTVVFLPAIPRPSQGPALVSSPSIPGGHYAGPPDPAPQQPLVSHPPIVPIQHPESIHMWHHVIPSGPMQQQPSVPQQALATPFQEPMFFSPMPPIYSGPGPGSLYAPTPITSAGSPQSHTGSATYPSRTSIANASA